MKKNSKNHHAGRIISLFIVLCMVLAIAPITAFAADSTVRNATELEAALENADCAEIKLGGNIETSWVLDVERTVTLDLNSYTLTSSASDIIIFRVRNDGNLTVKDSATGGKIDGQKKNGGFEVKGGMLTLEGGSIVNCMESDGDGSAVDISKTSVTETSTKPIKYGEFIMNGGAILDCKAYDDGGAVDIGSGCTFIMNGGTIGNCRAGSDGGAVFIKQSGAFELNGGLIRDCSAADNGGAVNIYQDGRFTMTGGTIKNCKLDGAGIGNAVYGSNDKAVVTMTGGTFEDCGVFPYSFDEFTVTFDSDGGSAVSEQKLRNAPAVKPTDPKKSGYNFAGWYLGEEEYTFTAIVTEDITLKAHWIPTATPTAINKVVIENVKFDYQPGSAPQATATKGDSEAYTFYEYWEEWAETEEGLVAVKFWYSDRDVPENQRITAFEEGKTYSYSIIAEANENYTFASKDDGLSVMLNGVDYTDKSGVILDGTGLMIGPEFMTSKKPATQKEIELIEINNATLTFKDGAKPVFTGTTPNDAPYALVFEEWRTDGEWTRSDEWFNDADHHGDDKVITAFDKNKSYNYNLYIKLNEKGVDEGWYFGPNTKLKINGKEVSFTNDYPDEIQIFGVKTGITMTPATSPGEKILGDVDGNGELNINDVAVMQLQLDKLYTETFDESVADFNGDGEFNIQDASQIQLALAHLV